MKWLILLSVIIVFSSFVYANDLSIVEGEDRWVFKKLTLEDDSNSDGVPDIFSTFTQLNETTIEIYVNDSIEKGSYKWASAICNISNSGTITKDEYNPATGVWSNTGSLNYGTLWGLPSAWCYAQGGKGFSLYGSGSGDKHYRLHFPKGVKEFELFAGKGSEVTVTTYQPEQKINYNSDWFDCNWTLKIPPDTTADNVFISSKGGLNSFGANITGVDRNLTLRYIATCNRPIETDKGIYIQNYNEKHSFFMDDICKYKNRCNVTRLKENEIQIKFIGIVNSSTNTIAVDPYISISDVKIGNIMKYHTETEPSGLAHKLVSDANLRVYYPFDSNGEDYAYKADTTNNGAVHSTGGKFSGAYYFGGSNDWLRSNHYSVMDITAQASWMGWIKGDNNGADSGAGCEYPFTKGDHMHFAWDDGGDSFCGIEAGVGGYCSATRTATLNADQWYHWACTYDGQYLRMYIDGALQDTQNCGSNPLYHESPNLHLGTYEPNDCEFAGYLDDIRIYDTELTIGEIAEVIGLTRDTYYGSYLRYITNQTTYGYNIVNLTTYSLQPNATNISAKIIAINQDYNCSVFPDNIGCYHLDNNSAIGETGTKIVDSAGYTNLTINTASHILDDFLYGSFNFVGGTSIYSANNLDSLYRKQELTVSAWFYPTSVGVAEQVIVSYHNDGSSAQQNAVWMMNLELDVFTFICRGREYSC